MNVLVLNCGSSSVKFQLVDPVSKRALAKGNVEHIGSRHALLTCLAHGKSEIKEVLEVPNHNAAIRLALSTLLHPEYGVISDPSEIDAVGQLGNLDVVSGAHGRTRDQSRSGPRHRRDSDVSHRRAA